MNTSEKSIHLAAQCWCDDETKDIEFDHRLARAFAKRFDQLQFKVDFYEAPERVKYVCRLYSELSDNDKKKIDDLMSALINLNKQEGK